MSRDIMEAFDEAMDEAISAELTQLRADLARAEGEREAYRKSAETFSELMTFQQERAEAAEQELAYYHDTLLRDIIRDARSAAEQERDTLKAECEQLKTVEPGKLIAEIEAEYASKTNGLIERHAAQLTTSCEEGYRQGVEWSMILTREYADCSSTQEERDSLVKLAQQIERHMRAESSTLPRTYEQIAGETILAVQQAHKDAANSTLRFGGTYEQGAEEFKEVVELATCIWQRWFKTDCPEWRPSGTLSGVLSQISNMATGLVEKGAEDMRDTVMHEVNNCFGATFGGGKLKDAIRALPTTPKEK